MCFFTNFFFFSYSPLVLLADDPEMPASLPGSAKPARNLVRSGQQSAQEVTTNERNATAPEVPSGRNPSRKRDERRKGAGRKNGAGGAGEKNGKTGKRSALPDRNNSTASGRKISNKTARINQDRTKGHNRRNKDKKRKKGT